jgi:NAD-dependent SIR2 family protein deacetylase
LYHNLQKFNLPYPEAIFDIDYFLQNPEPFFKFVPSLIPGKYKPTAGHYFIRLPEEKKLLLRHFTQNIDGLDGISGIPNHRLVECHGGFSSCHCTSCKTEYKTSLFMKDFQEGKVIRCSQPNCSGFIKPDIVFYGESLPERYFTHLNKDLPNADLLLIIGTSLTVYPVAEIVEYVRKDVPRVLVDINRVGKFDFNADKQNNNQSDNNRDVFLQGDIQTTILKLTKELGWRKEFDELLHRSK